MKNKDFNTKFLSETDKTGRHVVKSFRTGKVYYIEPIESEHTPKWGDVNPATGKVEGSYGDKYNGGVKEKDSLITKENGFDDIRYSGIGGSPYSVIEEMDSKYPTIER
jgi:hypothetical protein